MDKRKFERMITISRLDYTAGELTTLPGSASYPIRIPLEKGKTDEAYFITKEYSLTIPDDSVYHLPFLFNDDGSPWYEANLFFYRLSIDEADGYKTTDELRRKASMLLDYKMYCDDEGIDYLDFSSPRPGPRPSYRYFIHLLYRNDISGLNLNQRTSVVHSFYKSIAELPGFNLDIKRVDKTRMAFITFENGYSKQVEIRNQTVNVSHQKKPVPLGYVRDDGEDLRPLSNTHRDELIEVLDNYFSVDERLIHLIALNTGARKQSIFTMRIKHVKQLVKLLKLGDEAKILGDNSQKFEEGIFSDGTLPLKAGPKTGMDTKFDKPQTLRFPKKLAKQIETYAFSKEAKNRRKLFKEQHGDILKDDDMYLFLSSKGNCHYMAKEGDPRYRQVKSRPKGEHTDYLKKKLFKYVSASFPRSFTFHWQRATFAYKLYQHLIPHVVYDKKVKLKPGQLRPGEEIRRIQQRLHHKDRETTENYLKLFVDFDEKMAAQNKYEDVLFEGVGL